MELDSGKIREALQLLRETKQRPNVFGEEGHGFQIHAPLPPATVGEFENQHQIMLPADYRDFLINVGNGGAGPAYGLFKLGEMDNGFKYKRWRERDGFIGTLAEPFPHQVTWNDRTGQPEYEQARENDPHWEDEYQRRMDEWEEVYWNPANVNGAIPICHLGCAYRQWLVISGPEAGHVWDDDRADMGGLKPLQQKGRDRVTFWQWYSAWLDDALLKLSSGK